MMTWLRQRRHVVLSIFMNALAILAMAEALRTSVYVTDAEVVPRNPFALRRAAAQQEIPSKSIQDNLLEYKVGQHEKMLEGMKAEMKELRADFTHITEMLIGALVAIVINMAITLLAHRRQNTEERAET